MPLKRVFALGFALLLLPQWAYAEAPKWSIKAGQVGRYQVRDLKVDLNGYFNLHMPRAVTVSSEDFTQGQVYNREVSEFKDLIHHYALSIYPNSGGKGQRLSRTFQNMIPHSLSVNANGLVRGQKQGSNYRFEGQLQLSAGRAKGPVSRCIDSGSLKWSTQFDGLKGHVVRASFEFRVVIRTTSKKQAKPVIIEKTVAGTIVLIEKGKRSLEAFRKDVKAAIEKAVKKLRQQGYAGNGKNIGHIPESMGFLALQQLAMLRSGVDPEDSFVKQGFEQLSKMPLKSVFGASAYLMALEAKAVKRFEPSKGSTAPRFKLGAISRADKKRIQILGTWILKVRNARKGTWHYGPATDPHNPYGPWAAIALRVAQRNGVKVSHRVWKGIFDYYRNTQNPSEGLGHHVITRTGESPGPKRTTERGRKTKKTRYRGWDGAIGKSDQVWGSTTNAALASLAIAAQELKAAGRIRNHDYVEYQKRCKEALFWNARYFTPSKEPRYEYHGPGYYHHLVLLERACAILGVEAFDGRDWYRECAEELILSQRDDGGWGIVQSRHQTTRALLFLSRATLRPTDKYVPSSTPGETKPAAPKRAATGAGSGDRKDRATVLIDEAGGLTSLSGLLGKIKKAKSSQRKTLQKWFMAGLEKLSEVDRPVLIPGLITLFKSRANKTWAKKALREITGDSKLKKVEDIKHWHKTWEALDQAAAEYAYDRIELLRQVILLNKNTLLKKAAVLAAVRLKAVELAPDIATMLKKRKDKAFAQDCLSVFMNSKPKTLAEVQAWYAAEGQRVLKGQAPKRLVIKAAKGDKAAQMKITKTGKRYLSVMTRLARDPKIGPALCALLKTVTGEDKAASEWQAWYEANKDKIGRDGRLKKANSKKAKK